MLDTAHLYHAPPKIQSRPRMRRRQKQRIRNGVCPAALRAVTGARGYIAGTFPTLAVAALSCGSHRDSVSAAAAILKVEDSVLLADLLSGRAPLAETAQSIVHAVALIDAFRKASGAEREIFARVITPGALFDVLTRAP